MSASAISGLRLGRMAGRVLAIAWLLMPSLVQAVGHEYLPPEHWVYPALYRFEALGWIDLPSHTLLTRDQVVALAERAVEASRSDDRPVSARDRFNLDRVEREFLGEAARFSPRSRYDRPVLYHTDDAVAFEGDLDLSFVPDKPPLEPKWQFFGVANPEMRLHIGDAATYEVRYRLVMGPERGLRVRDKKPSPREKSFKGLTSLYERSYVTLPWNKLVFFFGRDYVDWGPCEDGNLLVSWSAGSLDRFGATLDFKRFHLSTFHAYLSAERQRTLSAHRLEYHVARWTIAISEAVLYTGRGVDFLYLLPFSSYYANQFAEREDDNVLWSIDTKYAPIDGLVLYASFMVDDFQFERDGVHPDKIGFDVGARVAFGGGLPVTVRARYRYVDIYTYTHRDTTNAWVTGTGDPIQDRESFLGAAWGPDTDELRVSAEWYPWGNVTSRLTLAYLRRGEGREFQPFEEGLDDPYPPFPSGVVERTLTLGVGLLWELGGNSSAGIDLREAKIANLDNQPSETRWETGVRIHVTWDL